MASTEDADAGDAPADSVAATLRSASFVHVVAHADAAAVAAGGLLARVADASGIAFQVSVARTTEAARRRIADTDGSAVAVGIEGPASGRLAGPEMPVTAAEVARSLGHEPDPTLVLAGLAAGDISPEGTTAVEAAGAERRAGVGVPTDDPVDGLAHTTLVHGPFSGEPEIAKRFLDGGDDGIDTDRELDAEARRRVGSLVALEASTATTGERGLAALGRALNPLAPGGPFATVAGYADVLAATTRESPGTAVALALGADVRESALGTWRDHALRVHRAVGEADLARHGGLTVARVDSGVWTAARLLRDFRSPEPVALAVGDGEAALAGPPGTGALDALSRAAEECEAGAGGTDTRAYASFDGDADDLVAAVRGLL